MADMMRDFQGTWFLERGTKERRPLDIGTPNAGTLFPYPWQRNTVPLQSQIHPDAGFSRDVVP